MSRLVLSIIFLLTLANTLFSQSKRDVIYLQDGNIIKGNITENNDTVIKIETCCGSIFTFHKNQLLSVEEETIPKIVYQVKQKGYLNFTSMGVLLGSPTNEKIAPFSLLSEHNYRFNKYLALGGVIGYEMPEESVIPLGLNVKGFVFDEAKNLFLGITGGYSFSLENPDHNIYESNSGGPFFSVELGANIPISSDNSFFIAIGYRYNELNYKRNDWWLGDVDRRVKYNRISIRLGLSVY